MALGQARAKAAPLQGEFFITHHPRAKALGFSIGLFHGQAAIYGYDHIGLVPRPREGSAHGLPIEITLPTVRFQLVDLFF